MDVVVSHYNESLRWLKKVPPEFRLILYCKGDPKEKPDLSFLPADRRPVPIHLPNLGRESHTWLHHLALIADDPPDVTVFLQGYPFDHASDTHTRLRQLAETGPDYLPDSGFDWWGFILETDDAMGRRVFVPWSKNLNQRELDINQRYRKVFAEDGPDEYRFRPGGLFAVSAKAVGRRSPTFYRQAADLACVDPDAAYCFERFWDRVFKVPPITREDMRGHDTLYFRPDCPHGAPPLPDGGFATRYQHGA